MRVAYLLADPGIPVGGTKGASVHVQELCRALFARGVDVTLVAQRATSDPPAGVELVTLDPGPVPRGPAGELSRIEAARDFERRALPVLETIVPDLVYERLSLFFSGGGRLARHLGAARLLEVNAPVAAERERYGGLCRRHEADLAETSAIEGAHVLAVSEPLAAWALERGAAAAEVVPNGVDADRFAPDRTAAAGRAIREGLSLLGCEVVGFVGSLKEWHGTDVLIRAAAALACSRPRLRVLVVGDGPERSNLERLTKDGGLSELVVFTGAVPAAAVPEHLAALDVACAPYLPAKGFYFSPLKVVEAMAAALPVVASRFAPIEAMLGGTGLLVSPGDPGALATGIASLLDDRGLAARLGGAARLRAATSHSWDGVARRTLDAAGLAGAKRAWVR